MLVRAGLLAPSTGIRDGSSHRSTRLRRLRWHDPAAHGPHAERGHDDGSGRHGQQHGEAIHAGHVECVLADYAEHSVVMCPGRSARGLAQIRDLFANEVSANLISAGRSKIEATAGAARVDRVVWPAADGLSTTTMTPTPWARSRPLGVTVGDV